jgi:hypothetical protein
MATTRRQLIDQIGAERQIWRSLVDEVGRDRMDEPGPMGSWTFKDLVSHLAGWRNRRLDQLEAAVRGTPNPPTPWPAELDDDDSINEWIRRRDEHRTVDDLLADYDRSFDRLTAVFTALRDDVLTDPGYFPWMEGVPAIEGDYFGHLHDEHEPSIRAWLASRRDRGGSVEASRSAARSST